MKSEYGAIYLICNIENRKCYIGQTNRYNKRIYHHFSGHSTSPHLRNAIKKYGESAFTVHILEVCLIEDLDAREIFWIATFDTITTGYNLTKGGEGVRGYNPTPETRRKLSEAAKGRVASPETRQKLSEFRRGNQYNKGRKASLETRMKMSETQKQIENKRFTDGHHTPEAKRKISEASKGNQHRKGHTPSSETRKKLSNAMKDKVRTPEHCKNLSESLRGRKLSDEHCLKISEVQKGREPWNKGKKLSPEHRRRIVESWKKRKARNS